MAEFRSAADMVVRAETALILYQSPPRRGAAFYCDARH
jgi:hypothetical protein